MKFLIDGHINRVMFRKSQWPEGVMGQLLTPLTRYKCGDWAYAIDNGSYSSLNLNNFTKLLKREEERKSSCLFVVVPDKVGCHKTTLKMFEDFNHLCEGWPKAFVAQDGFEEMPNEASTLFIGGTNSFKDSKEVEEIVKFHLGIGKMLHVGRVNGFQRFSKFHNLGVQTCDGSGVSRYDHMILKIKENF